MSKPIADAAQLAALAPPGGVLDPTDDSVNRALLDLWADRTAVARNRLAGVVRAFGPRLLIQGGFTLHVHSGPLSPAQAARTVAEVLVGEPPGPLIGALRGEDLLDQVETLIAAGCQFSDHQRTWPISSEKRTITSVWAAAPAAIDESARQSGARVLIRRQADEVILGGAPEVLSDHAILRVELIDHYVLHATARSSANLDELPDNLRAAISTFTDGSNESIHLTATSPRYDELLDIAIRLELAAGTGAFDRPLAECVAPRSTGAWIVAPRELLEFRYDLRTASDWLHG